MSTPRMAPWLERAWLDRYLERELDGGELEWFEAYILDKPELAARVENDNDLRDAVYAHSQASSEGRVAVNHASSADSGVASFRPRRAAIPLALAASLAAGVAIGSFLLRGTPAGDVIGDPTRVLYDTARGEALTPRVDHATSDSSHVLIDIAVPPGASDIVLHFDHAPGFELHASSDGIVTALVARHILERGSPGRVTFNANGTTHERVLPITPLLRRSEP